jgi:hypothetical protein
MVIFDTTILLVLLAPEQQVPTGVPDAVERVALLIKTLEQEKTKVLIPTPALAEALVRVDIQVASTIVEKLSKSSAFEIADFDSVAALEAAAYAQDAKVNSISGDQTNPTRQKIKVDRQILAIGKVRGCRIMYSNDTHMKTLAPRLGIVVIGIEELPSGEASLFAPLEELWKNE